MHIQDRKDKFPYYLSAFRFIRIRRTEFINRRNNLPLGWFSISLIAEFNEAENTLQTVLPELKEKPGYLSALVIEE